MALFVRQDEKRSELQQRLATELQARARDKAKAADQPDGVNDSQFIKGTQQTQRSAWVWIAAGVAVLVTGIVFIVQLMF